ncbi:MAG: 4-carboxy-4-hydroxy-2-oxoadipate aldolase/oxaloacetate decarboxylase [Candidatus Odinarchaeia archaeon]
MGKIVLNVSKPGWEIIEKFKDIPTPYLCEAMGKKGNMSSEIRPIFKGAHLFGVALTVLCPPRDNLTVHKALELAGKGDVLVIDAGNYTEAGLLGEIMCYAAKSRGVAGIVTNGAVRDVKAIEEMNFPVFAKSISPGGTVKEKFGSINVPIMCGNVIVNPGDIIVGDDDGVVVVPQKDAEKIAAEVQGKAALEDKIKQLIDQGKSTMEIYGFNEKLKNLKIEYEGGGG